MYKPQVLPIAISLVALLVSALTLFYNNLRQVDDIRVVAGSWPLIFIDAEGDFALAGEQATTFINAGNRSATINKASLIFIRGTGRTRQDCQKSENLTLDFKLSPTVVRPGDMAAMNLLEPIAWAAWRVKPGRSTVSYPKERAPQEGILFAQGDIVAECLHFEVVTRNKVNHVWVAKGIAHVTSIPKDGAVQEPRVMLEPISLVHWSWP